MKQWLKQYWPLLACLVFILVSCAANTNIPSPQPVSPMTLIGQQDGISVYRIFDHTNDSGYSLKALCYLAVSDKGMDMECP